MNDPITGEVIDVVPGRCKYCRDSINGIIPIIEICVNCSDIKTDTHLDFVEEEEGP